MFSRYEVDKRPKWLRWFLFETPQSATGEWWDRRDDMLRRRAPVRYFIQHDVRIIVGRQKHRIRDQWWKIRHRTTDRFHIVNTGLKPGYHDINERMLHASFALLVEYVEIGLASKNFEDNGKDPIKRGLAYLDWEINDPQCAGHQADTAATVKDLYLWWTVERPNRLNSWSAPEIWGGEGIRAKMKERPRSLFTRITGVSLGRPFRLGLKKRPQEERYAGEMARSVEEFYDAQDDGMLMRLVEIRSGLWT